MKEIRRESLLFMNDIENEFDAASTSYHIQNLNQLKYWLKKNEASIATTWTNMRDEHAAFFNQLNKKIDEMNELTKNYNTQTDKLHDVMLIIRELKIEQRERNIEAINSNILLSIIEDEVIVSTVTFKKLFDSSVFTDDKDSIIDDWLSVMRNKLEENANWFSIDVQQKTYVRIKIDDEAMKHFIFRFFKNSIKSYIIAKKIFDDLYQIFDDSNRRTNALKTYRYAAEWFGLVWVSTSENQTGVGLISCRGGVISVRFGSGFYRFEPERIIYRMYIYVDCFYI